MPLAAYADPQLFQRLALLRLRSRTTVDGQFAGQHTSARSGRAVEFSHHREYAEGDDPRRVDWKVFGRTDRLYVKQQEDESELTVNIIVDISGSMAYAGESPAESKQHYAFRIAVAIAHLARSNRDAVSLGVIGPHPAVLVPASLAAGPEVIADALDRLAGLTGRADEEASTALVEHCGQLAERLASPALTFWIGDCLDDPGLLSDGWRQFAGRRQELVVFQVLHRDEIEFPFDQHSRFLGLENEPAISLDPATLRGAYRTALSDHQAELERICRSLQADRLVLSTDRPLVERLPPYFADRMNRGL